MDLLSLSQYESYYDPRKVLMSPEFKILSDGAPELSDPEKNLACAYNHKKEVHMIQKPLPRAGPNECIVHVKNTGICG